MDAPELELEPVSPPYSKEIEESLIGAVIFNPGALRDIDTQPEDFFLDRNRFIWQAIQDLRHAGQDIDLNTLINALEKSNLLGEVGGYNRLVDIIKNCPSSYHAKTYAEAIRDDAKRRLAIEIARRITTMAFDRNSKLSAFIPDSIDQLSRLSQVQDGAVHWQKFLGDLYDEVDKAAANPNDIYGIPTGIFNFDSITGGLVSGEVMKLSGEPGIGKSMLAMQMVTYAASKGYPGACYHLEMSGRAVARRVISAMSKVTTRAMKTGKLVDDQWSDFTGAIDKASSLPIYMSDSSAWTTGGMRVDLERLKGLYGIRWVLVDYEALICDDPDKDDIQRSKIISSRLHGIIKDLGLSGLVIDDMNKEGIKGGSHGQASLAGSARKLYDADSIWIMRANKEQLNMVQLVSEKLREGEGSTRIVSLERAVGIPEFLNVTKERKL